MNAVQGPSAHDVARELRRRIPHAGIVKIHKLLYYCQGWQLAWSARRMFRENIVAWTDGPVVADLWHDEHKQRPLPAPTNLPDDDIATIEFVVSRYGHLTGKQLIRLTHTEAPWRDVSESDDPFATNLISDSALMEFFQSERNRESSARVADALLKDPAIKTRIEDALRGMRETPGQPDDLAAIARLVASHQ